MLYIYSPSTCCDFLTISQNISPTCTWVQATFSGLVETRKYEVDGHLLEKRTWYGIAYSQGLPMRLDWDV